MPRAAQKSLVLFLTLLGAACTTARAPVPDSLAAAKALSVSPANLVASISEVASGRNPDMREAGLVLKTVELNLLLGTEVNAGGKLSVVVLSAEAARRSEISFSQTFLLEIPASPKRGAISGPLVPGVQEFVETAMQASRDLARAAATEGLPQRLKQVELVAKIERSRKAGGGIAFTLPTAAPIAVGAGAERNVREENTIKLLFAAAP